MATVIDSQTPIASAPPAERLPGPTPIPPTISARDDTLQRFVLTEATWHNYVLLSDGVGERHIRVTFDGERVEIMAVSHPHEMWKSLIRYVFEALCLELGVNCRPYGNMTMWNEARQRGIEPDECYYIQREPDIQDKKVLDFSVDPFPDFAIEVEVSRSVLNRLEILAKLDVREVWRFDGNEVIVMIRDDDQPFRVAESSAIMPQLPIRQFSQFLREHSGQGLIELNRSIRQWLRDSRIGPAGS